MKNYDERINRIFEKGEKLAAKRNKRIAAIRNTCFAVSGMCAVILVGVGIWNNSALKNGAANNYSGAFIETQSTTDSSVVTEDPSEMTTFVTKTVPHTTEGTTSAEAVHTTVSSYIHLTTNTQTAVSTTTEKVTVTETSASLQIQTSTTSTTVQTTRVSESRITTSTTTTTSLLTTSTTTTDLSCGVGSGDDDPVIADKVYEKYESFLVETSDTPLTPGNTYRVTLQNACADAENIGDHLLTRLFTYKVYKNGILYHEEEEYGDIYLIKGFSADIAVAVRFESDDNYYIYYPYGTYPDTFGEYLDLLGLTAENLTGEARFTNVTRSEIDYDYTEERRVITDKAAVWSCFEGQRNGVKNERFNGTLVESFVVMLSVPEISLRSALEIRADGYAIVHKNYCIYEIDEFEAKDMIDELYRLSVPVQN